MMMTVCSPISARNGIPTLPPLYRDSKKGLHHALAAILACYGAQATMWDLEQEVNIIRDLIVR